MPRPLCPALVIFPASDCEFDVFVLSVLRASAKKDHDALAMFCKLDPIARPKIDAALKNARSDTFNVGEVAES